jgi:hypothetical protein
MSRLAAAFLILLLAPPSAAMAQGPGVFVDPDSPAGKEYALPLDQARREAAPDASGPGAGRTGRDSGGDASGSTAPPLFGEGIEPSDGAAAGKDGDSGATDSSDSSNRRRDGETPGAGLASRAGDGAPTARGSAAIEAAAGEGSGALLTAGMGAAVLAVGLLAGFGLRRVLRDR